LNNKRHGQSVISTATNQGSMHRNIFDGALNAAAALARDPLGGSTRVPRHVD
jgi:hypothetical protein